MSADSTDTESRCRMSKTTNSDQNKDNWSTLNDILTHPSPVHTVNYYRYSASEYHRCPASKIDVTKHGIHSPQVLTTFLPTESRAKEPSSHRAGGRQVTPYDQKGRYSDFCIAKNEIRTCSQCHSCRSTLVKTSDGLIAEAGSSNSEVASSVSNESNGEASDQLINAQNLSDPIERTRTECDRFEEENVYIFNPISYISETFATEDEEQ